MKYYGTKNNKDYGFYEENFENAVEITDEYWSELLTAQQNGKKIIPFDNTVLAVNENEYSYNNGSWVKLSKEESEAKQLKIQSEIRKTEILRELDILDNKRIRAVAEPSMKDDEITWLEYYNDQIKSLREELIQLNT
jgi:hypothetical protein